MKNWTDRFPGLSRLDQGLKGRIETNSNIISFKKNSLVFGPDKSPENMFFLISGTVRVQQVSATGREIVLYRLEAGQTCVLTTSCLLSFDQYSAEGRADTDLISAGTYSTNLLHRQNHFGIWYSQPSQSALPTFFW